MPSPLRDAALVALSLVAVSALVLAARWGLRIRPAATAAIRKAVHIAVGAWTIVVTPLFQSLGWALVPPVLSAVGLGLPRTRALLPRLAETPAHARGLWAYPLGVALVYLLFWDAPPRAAIVAAVVALAFADPAAAILGTRCGQRKYRGWGGGRTLEGSLAFLAVAAVGIGIVAHQAAGGAFPWRMGIGCGAAGAVAEAATPSGWDILTIPLVVATVYRVLS
jgi:dolichol kinase